MSSASASEAELRRQVRRRADGLCEYCLVHERHTLFGCEVDHIVSRKHGGRTEPANLAYSCSYCNRHKGSDIGSVAPISGRYTRFYNPRADRWGTHFALDEDDVTIAPMSDVGDVTERILKLNFEDRLLERMTLEALGQYPTRAARKRMPARA